MRRLVALVVLAAAAAACVPETGSAPPRKDQWLDGIRNCITHYELPPECQAAS
jgi:hypothetical protein